MPELALTGLRAEPLGSYLKALGVLRLVAEQVDGRAAGWWVGDAFWLRSRLDAGALVDFFVREYTPTPLLAPWNGGSGFGPKDAASSPTAVTAVERVASSDLPRLAPYRAAIAAVRQLVATEGWFELGKEQQVALCRNVLPDASVEWIDAAVVLTAESRRFPPLLGTGGNDGRFDFSANFLQRIGEVTGLVPRPRGAESVERLAEAVLFGVPVRLDKAPIGQFDPAAAGGVGSSPLGPADSLANPWDLVLILEGALVFASAAARRLSTGRAAVGVPFMVDTTPVGHPSAAADENSRGELWAPIWSAPTTFAELRRLIGEGRAEFGDRQARSGLDVARAVATLGVDRGVREFVRHSFLERNGLATFAIPVGRMQVPERPRRGAALMAEVDRWSDGLRRAKNPPASLAPLLRALDSAQYQVAADDDDRRRALALGRVLVALADLEQLALSSRALADVGPVTGLRAVHWAPLVDDGSAEFELASALASLRPTHADRWGALRGLFNDLSGRVRGPDVPGIGRRPLPAVLAHAHHRLAVTHPPAEVGEPPNAARRWLGFVGHPVSVGPITRFLEGSLDDARVTGLLRALLLLDWSKPPSIDRKDTWRTPPTAFAVLAPSFHQRPLRSPFSVSNPPVAETSWLALLAAGRTAEVVADGLRKLRIAGLEPLVRNAAVIAAAIDPSRLAAAALAQLQDSAVRRLLHLVVHPSDESTEQEKAGTR